jgi:hypothetical protein
VGNIGGSVKGNPVVPDHSDEFANSFHCNSIPDSRASVRDFR